MKDELDNGTDEMFKGTAACGFSSIKPEGGTYAVDPTESDLQIKTQLSKQAVDAIEEIELLEYKYQSDKVAALAMQSLITVYPERSRVQLANLAYDYADAMMKVRQERSDER